jgi:hypothetical protein
MKSPHAGSPERKLFHRVRTLPVYVEIFTSLYAVACLTNKQTQMFLPDMRNKYIDMNIIHGGKVREPFETT